MVIHCGCPVLHSFSVYFSPGFSKACLLWMSPQPVTPAVLRPSSLPHPCFPSLCGHQGAACLGWNPGPLHASWMLLGQSQPSWASVSAYKAGVMELSQGCSEL